MATYALIPGGGGNPWEWHRLVPELASREQDAIAIRLPTEDDMALGTSAERLGEYALVRAESAANQRRPT